MSDNLDGVKALANRDTPIEKAFARNGVIINPETQRVLDSSGQEHCLSDCAKDEKTYYITTSIAKLEKDYSPWKEPLNLRKAMTVMYSIIKPKYCLVMIKLPSNITIQNQKDKVPYEHNVGEITWYRYVPNKQFDMTKERNLIKESIVYNESPSEGYY